MADQLFKSGDFVLHSGSKSNFLIDCEALTNAELEALAAYVVPTLPGFEAVVGIPRGGLRFAEALARYIKPGTGTMLLVDDVYTTGASMTEARMQEPNAIGVVIFARRQPPFWITPIFTM